MRRACVIVAKAPRPGNAKTRLVPPLTPEGAATLYAGFLLDAVDLALKLDWEQVSVIHPAGSGAALAQLVPPVAVLLEQPGKGLAAALTHAVEHHLDAGFDRVVLIGSDNPTLPPAPVHAAARALDHVDLSIGPSLDGGYYLLGMRRMHRELFEDIEWSTSRVYAQTLDRASELGLRVRAVQAWFDVDSAQDLERLYAELGAAEPSVARHTRAALDELNSTPLQVAPVP
jgi:rSAM/selenodomain-associated transferase 1